MIVISLRGVTEIPPHVKLWMEEWPLRAEADRAALVALVGSDQETWHERQLHVEELRRAAERRGLAFLCNQDGWERVGISKPDVWRTEARVAASNEGVAAEDLSGSNVVNN